LLQPRTTLPLPTAKQLSSEPKLIIL
jgi:hypothetical protein